MVSAAPVDMGGNSGVLADVSHQAGGQSPWRGNSLAKRQPRTVSQHSIFHTDPTFPPRRRPATSEAPIDYRLAGPSCAAVSSPMAHGVRAISVREGSRGGEKKKTRSAPNSGAAGARGAMDALAPPAAASITAECTNSRQYSITHKSSLVVLGSPYDVVPAQ